MPMQTKSGFVGLHTNIAESQMRPGALLGAENVVIRRPGAVEPRDGVQRAGTVTGGTGYAAWGFSWRGTDFYLRNDGSNVFNWRDTSGNAYTFTDENLNVINPQPMRRDMFSRAESRANLYLPYEGGVLKKETGTGAWLVSGLPIAWAFFLSTATTGTWLGNNEQVAYRFVGIKTDANGLVIRSVPTGQYIVQNTSGAARAVNINGGVATTNFTVDSIEVYRSRNFPTSVTPDDELRLVATIDAAAIILQDDLVVPATRDVGATIYTAPSRGGIVVQNERPPACAAVAPYRGSLFFGNVRNARKIKFSHNFNTSLSGSATGIGIRVYNGNTTNGSTSITSMSSTTGLEKGMKIVSPNLAEDTHITNISGSTLTISVAATGTSVGGGLSFIDAVKVGGEWISAQNFDRALSFNNIGVHNGMQAYAITPAESGYTSTYVVESLLRTTAAQTIQATHGSEYFPPLPNYDGTPMSIPQDVWPGGIMWSKTDEPEHVPPGNYAFVGDVNKAILGLVPTRDALFILKEDGLFRLTGIAGEWRIDPMDPTTFCVLPNSVRAMFGKGYFLSQKGVLAISDAGLETVSTPVDDVWKPIIDGIVSRWNSTGFYELANITGSSYAAVYERENEYTLMTSDTGPAYVFNSNTGAWTTWVYNKHSSEVLPNRSLFNFERLGKCVYGLGTDYYTTLLSTSAVLSSVLASPRFDRETAVTASSYSAANATVTFSTAVNAMVDDVIQDAGGKLWRVTAQATGVFTVAVALMGDTTGAAFTTGASFLYRSLRSVVTVGFMEPSALQKSWQRIVSAWSQLSGAVVLRHAFQSSEYLTSIEEDTDLKKRVNGYTTHTYGYAHPWLVPTAHARAWAIRASTKVVMTHGSFRLEGVSIGTTPMEDTSPAEVAA